MIRTLTAAALLLPALTQPALASGPIEIREGRPFTHERSGAKFPGRIAGLKLNRMTDFSDDQFDVAGVYGGIDDGDELSVYLYRAAIPDVSLWTDMVVRAVQFRPQFKPVDPAAALPRFFTPEGAGAASGMRLSYYTVEGAVQSTGVALVQRGNWLLKIRVSSTGKTVAEIDAIIDEALAAFAEPKAMAGSPAAYAVQPCPDKLDLPRATPSDVKDERFGATLFMVATTSIVLPEDDEKLPDLAARTPVVWCEDTRYDSGITIYRPDARKDYYIIAMSDAGRHIAVGHVGLLEVLARAPDAEPYRYPVIERTSQDDRIRGLFDTLPTPDQAWGANESGVSMAATDRQSNIQINSDYFSGGEGE